MKNIVVIIAFIISFIISFILGFMCHKLVSKNEKTDSLVLKNKIENTNSNHMKKVTGIGGIFFKCKDTGKMKEWYKTHLGLNTDDYGATFKWY